MYQDGCIQQTDSCKVNPADFPGSIEVVPLHFWKLAGFLSAEDLEEIYFGFRIQQYIYLKGKGTFSKLSYPSGETLDTNS